MPRQFDEYGFNRQYRRDIYRKPNPFPYRLPFLPGFATNHVDDPDAGVSARTASRYRQVIRDLMAQAAQRRPGNKRAFEVMAGRNAQHNLLSGGKRKWQHYLDTQKAAEFLKDRQVPTNGNAKHRREQRVIAVQNKHFDRFAGIPDISPKTPRWIYYGSMLSQVPQNALMMYLASNPELLMI